MELIGAELCIQTAKLRSLLQRGRIAHRYIQLPFRTKSVHPLAVYQELPTLVDRQLLLEDWRAALRYIDETYFDSQWRSLDPTIGDAVLTRMHQIDRHILLPLLGYRISRCSDDYLRKNFTASRFLPKTAIRRRLNLFLGIPMTDPQRLLQNGLATADTLLSSGLIKTDPTGYLAAFMASGIEPLTTSITSIDLSPFPAVLKWAADGFSRPTPSHHAHSRLTSAG